MNKELKLYSIIRPKKPAWKRGTTHKVFENKLKQNFTADKPNQIWCTSMSAGRIYDKIGNYAYGVVKYVLPQGVICTLTKKSLVKGKK